MLRDDGAGKVEGDEYDLGVYVGDRTTRRIAESTSDGELVGAEAGSGA